MRVNLEWLREWVDVAQDADRLAAQLTTAGLEVESVEAVSPPFEGIIVGHVTNLEPHPKADRLKLCEVFDGQSNHPIVCGAPNVEAGMKSAFAPVGAVLPDGSRIESVELRGVRSQGMLCSAKELGLSDDAEGILALEADAPAGVSLRDHLKLDDAVLDIDLTPNRGDCFSVLGVARETAAIEGHALPLRDMVSVPHSIAETFQVSLQAPQGCPRFVGRVIRGMTTGGTSPLWMQERLRRVGLRPIHPVVDVTNYVMLELGQPLHAYDLNRLTGSIVVRFAQPGESLALLGGRELELDPDVLVIADESGAIAMAGVMGGQSTAVEATTADVFLEAAFFSPETVAGRARRYGLHTDASLRFERGVDPQHQARAIERATELLLEIAGGEAGPLTETVAADHVPARQPITLRKERLDSLLGLPLPSEQVDNVLKVLHMDVQPADAGWRVTPPSFRFDLEIEEDLVEEVGRLVGYDNIPATPASGADRLGAASEKRIDEERIADLMVARGYTEVINYSFVDETLEALINPGVQPVYLANPISQDMNVMRRSLWPGLLTTAQQNLSRQQPRVKIFEIGGQFYDGPEGIMEIRVVSGLVTGPALPEHWDSNAREVDYFDVKADAEALLELTGRADPVRFQAAEHPALSAGQTARVVVGETASGWIGVLHPELQRRLEFRHNVVLFALRMDVVGQAEIPTFSAFSKFPWVRRDLAVVVDENVTAEELVAAASEAGGALLQNVVIFDVYRGKAIDSRRKSVALGLILQHTSRTLTDADADRAVQSVTQRLERALRATIRT